MSIKENKLPSQFTNSNYIHEEVIFNILSYLPVTSLIRFRCVCKSWQSMISSPHFIDPHLTNSKKTLFLLSVHSSVVGSVIPDKHVHLSFYQDLINLTLLLKWDDRMKFVSTCNGIICVSQLFSGNIYLLNPLTRQSKSLPDPTPTVTPAIGTHVGFGFDCISNDYKVFRLHYYTYSSTREGMTGGVTVDVYSMNADSWSWIELSGTMRTSLFRLHYGVTCSCLIKGVLYYDAYDQLLSFDLHNEVFGLMPMPGLEATEKKSRLFDFEGSLAFISTSTDINDGSVRSVSTLWTLEDVCGVISWTKKFSFKHGFRAGCQFVYLSAGKFVIYEYDILLLYDYKNKKSEELQKPNRDYGELKLVKYTPSLVSFDGFKPTKFINY